jgi:putative (di)nucleoside polyphosphate hydrolase
MPTQSDDSTKRPPQYFRAGVGAAIINHQGLVLALERAGVPGAWQLPQGGLKAQEGPLRAAKREVAEETGIREEDLELLDRVPEPLVYELPAEARTRRTGRGQVQYWFLFRFNGMDADIDSRGGGEFRSWRWLPFGRLLSVVARFRRPVYRRLAERFAGHLSRAGGESPERATPSSPSRPPAIARGRGGRRKRRRP